MGFGDSINGFLRLCNLGDCPYRITVLGSSGVFIEGVVKILDVKKEKVTLLVKCSTLLIEGNDLSIGSYIEKDLTVHGKVEKISWR